MLFTLGGGLIITSGGAAGDGWISVLAACAVTLISVVLYVSLIKKYPGKTFFEICGASFGPFIGRVAVIIFMLYAVAVGGSSAGGYAGFIRSSVMESTPRPVILFVFCTVCVYIAVAGTSNITRLALALLPPALLISVLTFAATYNRLSFSNLLPVMYNGIAPVAQNALYAYALPFSGVLFLIPVYTAMQARKKRGRLFIVSVAAAGIILAAVTARNLAILGGDALKILKYPSYYALSAMGGDSLFERSELILVVYYTVTDLFKTAVCAFFAASGLNFLFFKMNKSAQYIITGVFIFCAGMLFSSDVFDAEFFKSIAAVAAPAVCIGLPAVLLIMPQRVIKS